MSDRVGHKNIWRLTLAEQSLRQVTRSSSDIMGAPNWSWDRTRLIAGVADADTLNAEFILHSIDPNTGSMAPIDAPSGPWIDMNTFERLRPPIQIFSGVESADGDVFSSRTQLEQEPTRIVVRMFKFNHHTQTRAAMTPAGASYSEFRPQVSNDGNLLSYFRQYTDRRTEIRILNLTTERDEAIIKLTDADDASYYAAHPSRPNYAFTPDDQQIAFWHGGKIHVVNLADRSSEIIPFRLAVEREVTPRALPTVKQLSETGEATVIRWPSLSRDGQTMVFAAIGYVWVKDLATGVVRRLTRSNDFEYMPALSPDSQSVAFISFAQSGDDQSGRLMIADIEGGRAREVLASQKEIYLLPKWSQDGSMIALIREVIGGRKAILKPPLGGRWPRAEPSTK